MSLLGSTTKADFLPWDEMLNLVGKLERDGKNRLALLVATGAFTGLRISDLNALTWEQVVQKDTVELVEKKTGKQRTIKVNEALKDIARRIMAKLKPQSPQEKLFLNAKKNKPWSVQYINRTLKTLRYAYRLTIGSFSTHTFRKTFGRRIWQLDGFSERAVTMLGQIFNHSSNKITRRYLGITQKEINDVYDLL